MVENGKCDSIKFQEAKDRRGLITSHSITTRCPGDYSNKHRTSLHLRQLGQNSLAVLSGYRRQCHRRFLSLDTGLLLCNGKRDEMSHGTAEVVAIVLAREQFAETLDREYLLGASLGNRRFPLVTGKVPAVDPAHESVCDGYLE